MALPHQQMRALTSPPYSKAALKPYEALRPFCEQPAQGRHFSVSFHASFAPCRSLHPLAQGRSTQGEKFNTGNAELGL